MSIDEFVHVASGLNVWHVLEQKIAQHGQEIAIQAHGQCCTFAQFGERVDWRAIDLRSRGVGPNDRVAVISENRPEYLELVFACAKVGAILACQNWRLALGELRHCLALVKPRIVFASERFEQAALAAAPEGTTTVRWSIVDPIHGAPVQTRCTMPADGGERGLFILYTSGTTGFPKAALVTHRAALARMTSLAIDRPMPECAAFVAWSPFFHMGSMDFALATLLRGGKVIVMDGFDADALADTVATEDIGHLTIVPGVVERFITAMRKSGRQTKNVSLVGVMADLVPPHLIAELTELLRAPYCNTFGSTETGSAPASRAVVEVGVTPQTLAKLQNSMCAVRLIDDDGVDVVEGQPGELILRSPTLFSGYWGDTTATAAAFKDGWYRMGDVFVRQADGTLQYVDRKKYLIKSGGENIYPAEVERALRECPGVDDAVVVRQADARWGEIPVAIVVPRQPGVTAREIIDGCRGAIASYKLPRRIVFACASVLPRNASGKVERIRLETFLAKSDASLEWIEEGSLL